MLNTYLSNTIINIKNNVQVIVYLPYHMGQWNKDFWFCVHYIQYEAIIYRGNGDERVSFEDINYMT